jgi:NAD(P)-dependent dehydrogenase (short-subunit alcohol dehydrogenase family)
MGVAGDRPALGRSGLRTTLCAMDLNNSTAIVTGGASGIGAASARALAARGATVIIADLNAELGEALASEIGGVFAQLNVTNSEQITEVVEQAASIAPLKALVNSAGIANGIRTIGRDGQIESAFPMDKFRAVIEVNLIGTFDMIRQAATVMSRNEPDANGQRGAIVNMASVAAFDGQIGQVAYSFSKGGVVGATLPLARDLSGAGIRVNTIAPGLIDTPIYNSFPDPEAMKAQLGQSVLFPKRLGSGDELASMVVELITNDYMNAETIRVDGGIRLPPK